MSGETFFTDTIVALATPPGRSGVAVIRLSGPHCRHALAYLGIAKELAPRHAQLCHLREPETGKTLDMALALFFPSPHSFTGEDVLELQVHGSRAIIDRLLILLTSLPHFRLAEAGEFARRAFMLGKMDLTEIEALADLIDAESEAQREQAIEQMQGRLKHFCASLRAEMLELLSYMEALIDFSDDDLPTDLSDRIKSKFSHFQDLLQSAIDSAYSGERVRQGFSVAIIGEPNVGKSSLLNYLAARDVAIVSDKPGTTRDVLEVPMHIGPHAVTFYDTAGIRETDETVEKEGIRRAKERAQQADVVLVLYNTDTPPELHISNTNKGKKIYLRTKCDLHSNVTRHSHISHSVSSYTGEGIEKLLSELKDYFDSSLKNFSPLATRERHKVAFMQAQQAVYLATDSGELEIQSEYLRQAAKELGKITGAIVTDEVLGRIFSQFCIGK